MAENLRLELGLEAPRRARAWLREVCADRGLDDLNDEATLMLSELVTNAVLHAQTDCVIRAELADHTVRVNVTDQDRAHISPLALLDGAERGRGLSVVAILATTWGVTYDHAGKSVWFTLTADDGAGPSAGHDARVADRRLAGAS